MLVLKDILGGSLKITSENSNNFARQKIASKESLDKNLLRFFCFSRIFIYVLKLFFKTLVATIHFCFLRSRANGSMSPSSFTCRSFKGQHD